MFLRLTRSELHTTIWFSLLPFPDSALCPSLDMSSFDNTNLRPPLLHKPLPTLQSFPPVSSSFFPGFQTCTISLISDMTGFKKAVCCTYSPPDPTACSTFHQPSKSSPCFLP